MSENGLTFDEIIIDGTVDFFGGYTARKDVNNYSESRRSDSARFGMSIIAKVARDKFMAEQDNIYPGYDFSSHVGYGGRSTERLLDNSGVTPPHRLSFAPLAKYANTGANSQNTSDDRKFKTSKKTQRVKLARRVSKRQRIGWWLMVMRL